MLNPALPLLVWPIIALMIMSARGMAAGVIWVVVLGYLFLPPGFGVDLPALPPYKKGTAIAVALVLGLLLLARRKDEQKPAQVDGLANAIFVSLVVVFLISPILTVLDNGRVLIDGPTVRSGLTFRDVFASWSDAALVLVPFYVGRRLLATPEQHAKLLTILVIMGLAYTFLALWEARMSPQLNRTLFGYFPHSWVQHIRGGFRPIIFLNHGLSVGFLLLTVLLGCGALSRQFPSKRAVYLMAVLWVLAVLVLSRNLGATMLAVLFLPVVLFLPTGLQARVAAIVAIIFLSFPALRQAELLKFDGFLSFVEGISADRAASLQYRLDNEDELLARGLQKPLFGWGGWARQLVYDDRGELRSVSDGLWIIKLGRDGWVGYLSFFGLIAAPLLLLNRTRRREPLQPATAGLAVIAAANLVYLVPNSTLSAIGWLGFGALAGYVQYGMARKGTSDDDAAEPADPDLSRPQQPRYSRFGPVSRPPAASTVPAAPSDQRSSRRTSLYRRW